MTTAPWRAEDPEADLAAVLVEHTRRRIWFHRHPLATLRALLLLGRLPVLTYAASDTTEGEMVAGELRRSRLGRFAPIHEAASVLRLPRDGQPYNLGRARATQRRKARAARRLGVTSRLVTDPDERRRLLDTANAFEMANPRSLYRVEDPDNDDLLDVGLWIAAFQGETPILLAVIPQDAEFAILRYFRTLTHNEASSTARYLMTEVVAEELARRGARYLCDTVSPFRLRRGVLQFARMVGFRLARVRVV